MSHRLRTTRTLYLFACAAGLTTILLTTEAAVEGQGRGGAGRGAAPPATGKTAAPFDPTGYWVSVITETGACAWFPQPEAITLHSGLAAGKKIADAWDMAKDEAAGNECKYYGAASLMYQPTRLHVTWQDDNTLRMETDAGTQTRVFEFGSLPPSQTRRRSWQGSSSAVWEARGSGRSAASSRYLKVTTTNMLSGYLRKNGVPYSDSAVLTEYFDLFREANGDVMMFVTTVVEDRSYLDSRYVVISHFKKEPDGAKWDPTPCSARW